MAVDKNTAKSILKKAVEDNNLPVVRTLLCKSSDPIEKIINGFFELDVNDDNILLNLQQIANGFSELDINDDPFSAIEQILSDFPELNIDDAYEDDDTLLAIAAKNRHLEMVQLLLEKGANVNQCHQNGIPPLAYAVGNKNTEIAELLLLNGANSNAVCDDDTVLALAANIGHLEMVQLLLKKGADVNQCHQNGISPLGYAVEDNKTEIAELLLAYEANPNAAYNNNTLLSIAVIRGRIGMVRLLLEQGADVNQCRQDGKLPLVCAVEYNHTEIAELLLANGANPDAAYNDDTLLDIAAKRGHIKIVDLLFKAGANIDQCHQNGIHLLVCAVENNHTEIAKALLDKGANPNAGYNDYTLLAMAAKRGHIEMVQLLLSQGANVDQYHQNGTTPLVCAVENKKGEIAEVLLANGANPNEKVWVRGESRTLLQWALSKGNVKTVLALLQAGAEFNISTIVNSIDLHSPYAPGFIDIFLHLGFDIDQPISKDGRTLLHAAAIDCNKDLVAYLLLKGANPNSVDSNGKTPLHHAADYGYVNIVRLLVDADSNIEARDELGKTPLFYAALSRHDTFPDSYLGSHYPIRTVRYLLSKNADVNTQNNDGNTPLHHLASIICLNPKITKLLLAQETMDTSLENKLGFTPRDLAKERAYELKNCSEPTKWLVDHPKLIEGEKIRCVNSLGKRPRNAEGKSLIDENSLFFWLSRVVIEDKIGDILAPNALQPPRPNPRLS